MRAVSVCRAIEAMIEKMKDNTPPEFFAIVHPDDRDEMAAILSPVANPEP